MVLVDRHGPRNRIENVDQSNRGMVDQDMLPLKPV